MNIDDPWPSLEEAEARVLGIQVKLHQWATDSPQRRFCDLFNRVAKVCLSECMPWRRFSLIGT